MISCDILFGGYKAPTLADFRKMKDGWGHIPGVEASGHYWSPESQIQYSIQCFLSKLKVHWGSNASPWQSRVSMDLSRWENKCNLIKGRGGHQSWNEVYFLMITWSQRRGNLSGAPSALHPAWRRMSLKIRCEWPWVELQSYRSDMRFRKN